MPRTDASGAAMKGSQLSMQAYVNRRVEVLNEALMASMPSLREAPRRVVW